MRKKIFMSTKVRKLGAPKSVRRAVCSGSRALGDKVELEVLNEFDWKSLLSPVREELKARAAHDDARKRRTRKRASAYGRGGRHAGKKAQTARTLKAGWGKRAQVKRSSVEASERRTGHGLQGAGDGAEAKGVQDTALEGGTIQAPEGLRHAHGTREHQRSSYHRHKPTIQVVPGTQLGSRGGLTGQKSRAE